MRINDVLDRLDDVEYPATPEDVIVELGDPELTLQNGTDRLDDVFERTTVRSVDCPEDAKLTVLSALDESAIGLKGYSDRDPPVMGESHPSDRMF